MAVMIGIDPHKGSHTAVVIGPSEEPLGRQRVRACPDQAQQLLAWAAAWPERTWAAGGATGLGRMLAQQLAAAGEHVLDIQPKLAARVRLPGAGDVNKNDPNDARSVAVAALRSRAPRQVAADGHAAVLKILAKRHRDLARSRNQVACRLHAVLRAGPWRLRRRDHRRPGRPRPGPGLPGRGGCRRPPRPGHRVRGRPAPPGRPAPRVRQEAGGCGPGLRHLPDRPVRRRPGHRRAGHRRCSRCDPVPQPQPLRRLQRHRAGRGVLRRPEGPPAVAARQPAPATRSTWPRSPRSGTSTATAAPTTTARSPKAKPTKKPLRSLKRRISDAIYARLRADARQAAAAASKDPGGQPGNDSDSSAAGSHPGHRLFGQVVVSLRDAVPA
jgi:Transposase